jgi:hypothetical protein
MIGLADILVGTVGKVIDRVFPDPAARDAAKLELLRMEQAGQLASMQAELQLSLAQIGVNQADAASNDPFQRRWRPAVGWVCCAGLAYQFVGAPVLGWTSGIWGWPEPPHLQMGDLITILLGLLGLGGLRTAEKLQGRA